MPGTAQVNVNPRKIPRQARAQATVEAIYKKLCAAAGLLQGAPILEFDDASAGKTGAFTDFDHEPTRIVVERKALETCATFGARTNDAVAFLLGHELAHFSMGHGWGMDFQRISDHSKVKAEMAQAFENNKAYHLFETQADHRGAFFAYIAGYVPDGACIQLGMNAVVVVHSRLGQATTRSRHVAVNSFRW